SPPVQNLLLSAKHLFVAALVASGSHETMAVRCFRYWRGIRARLPDSRFSHECRRCAENREPSSRRFNAFGDGAKNRAVERRRPNYLLLSEPSQNRAPPWEGDT